MSGAHTPAVPSRPRSADTPPVAPAIDSGSLPVVHLMGVRIHAITEMRAVEYILDAIEAGIGGVVVTPNLDHLRRCVATAEYREVVARSDLSLPDGMPLVVASRIRGTPLPERVAGSDLISSLSQGAAARGRSIFLLGGNPGTAARAAELLQERYPGLQVAGTSCPAVGFESDPGAAEELRRQLRVSRADIVFVGLGSPKQERVIGTLRSEVPGAWWLGVGVSFSFLSGDVPRAPTWMRRVGLEWFHRLLSEPRRLFKRYLVHGFPFAVRLMLWAMWGRLRGAGRLEN